MNMANLTRYLPVNLRISIEERFHYLSLVAMLVRRELKVKYRGAILGYAWSMLNPLLTMLVITMVFGHLTRGIPNYNLFVLSGVLTWNVTTQTITLGTQAIVGAQGLLKKVKLPIWIFPMVPLGSSATNFALSLIPYTIFFMFSDLPLPADFLLFLPVFLTFVAFLCGVSLLLSCLNVFFRDVGHTLDPIMALFFYASPIIYDRHSDMIPENIALLLGFNPFTHFIEAMRVALYGGQLTLKKYAIIFSLACLALGVGILTYKKVKTKILYNL
jgi:ABC-type polysaccharide/polyol phosphate export permease